MYGFTLNIAAGTAAAAVSTAGLAITAGTSEDETARKVAEKAFSNNTGSSLERALFTQRNSSSKHSSDWAIKAIRTLVSVSDHANYSKVLAELFFMKIGLANLFAAGIDEEEDPGGVLTIVFTALLAEFCQEMRLPTGWLKHGMNLITFIRLLGAKEGNFALPELTAQRLSLKAIETLGSAAGAEAQGGFLLAAAGGTMTTAALTKIDVEAVEKGADKRVANYASTAAFFLWSIFEISCDLYGSFDLSISDLISTWALISVLSGLMAALFVTIFKVQNALQN